MLGSPLSADAFEEEAILLPMQPAPKGHAFARERKDTVSDLNLATDLLTQPGRHDGSTAVLAGVEQSTQADSAVLIQSINFGLAQTLVVSLGFFG